jgi:hypothetical protein
VSAKASRAKVAQRVRTIYRLLRDGLSPTEIRQYVEERTDWDIGERQFFEYLSRARALFDEMAKTEREEELGRALARLHNLYGKALNDKDHRQALSVQRELNELLGLYVPKRSELSGRDGKPIQVQEVPIDLSSLSDEELAFLEAIHAKLGTSA